MDELINGTVSGWPVGVQLMRNPGEKWVGVHAAAYTDEGDRSAPHNVQIKVADLEGDFETKRAAMKSLKRGGFVPDEN